ncbi:hypothetical protein [Streptomyces aurantiogriseus]|uniref:Uncharacterized protein n=1 Tax=Streptomyces aurantiogriseus TaxID=66870 RepID=A0A918EZC8_9ACTN|nr:hypothetical protein [Streptomyces aurantiogriseus]GGQ93506.1 hypothetical protein GCM10010251_05260 [Streptomyces aurantiogriseus]
MTASTVSAQETHPCGSDASNVGAAPGKTSAAADRAVAHNAVALDVLGRRLELPPPDQLAFLAGVGVLAAMEIIEWPVALALSIGHQLAHSHHGRVLREFGNALEEA